MIMMSFDIEFDKEVVADYLDKHLALTKSTNKISRVGVLGVAHTDSEFVIESMLIRI